MTTFGEVGNVETMRFFADETGGRAYAHTNDLASSIRRAVEDSRLTYVLGYYPTDQALDGNYRSISVGVKRKGLVVQYRRGYWAAAPEADRKARDAALRSVLQRPLAATQVRLSSDASYDAATSQLDLQLVVDLSPVSLSREGERWTGSLDVLVAEVASDGRGTIVHQKALDVSLTEQERIRARLVRDAASGHAGSLIIPAPALRR